MLWEILRRVNFWNLGLATVSKPEVSRSYMYLKTTLEEDLQGRNAKMLLYKWNSWFVYYTDNRIASLSHSRIYFSKKKKLKPIISMQWDYNLCWIYILVCLQALIAAHILETITPVLTLSTNRSVHLKTCTQSLRSGSFI